MAMAKLAIGARSYLLIKGCYYMGFYFLSKIKCFSVFFFTSQDDSCKSVPGDRKFQHINNFGQTWVEITIPSLLSLHLQ